MSKARANVDEWRREIAPSDDLRKWFQHDPAKFEEFRRRYRKELSEHMGSVEKLSERARRGDLTILYSAHDKEHNNAAVLKEFLEEYANNGRGQKAG